MKVSNISTAGFFYVHQKRASGENTYILPSILYKTLRVILLFYDLTVSPKFVMENNKIVYYEKQSFIIGILDVDFHKEKDTEGSRQEFIK